MNKFSSWGIKIRKDPKLNYYSIWDGKNLKTVRLRIDDKEIKSLPIDNPEFIDCGITEKCNAHCNFCYVEASKDKREYQNICETWKKWIKTFPEDVRILPKDDSILRELIKTHPRTREEMKAEGELGRLKLNLLFNGLQGKPFLYTSKIFQVCLGSVGEPTIHPEFSSLLREIYESGVVPNYTTNGIVLSQNNTISKEILEATKNFCGGIAVSYGNRELRGYADKAIKNLLKYGNCRLMLHCIISDTSSVEDFLKIREKFKDEVNYFVLLPLKKHGRSTSCMTDEAFLYLAKILKEKNITNVAFGANFLPFLQKYSTGIELYEYPEERYSKNVLLGDGKVIITENSFNLKPLKVINV